MTITDKPVKYRGVAFENGDAMVILPPLNTRQLETLAAHIDAITEYQQKREEEIEAAKKEGRPIPSHFVGFAAMLKEHYIPVVREALQRNYENVKDDDVAEMITMENYGRIFAAVLGTTSEPKVKLGEQMPAIPAPERPIFETSTGS